MCFSAETSFASAVVLVPAGLFCLRQAIVKAPRYFLLALTPTLFGIQQAAEGFVWLGLTTDHPPFIRWAAPVFLLFALGFWPTWASVTVLMIESRPALLRVLAMVAALSSGWFWIWCWPLVIDPSQAVAVEVVHHSLRYEYGDMGWLSAPSRFGVRCLYLATVSVPFMVMSDRRRLLVVIGLGSSSAALAVWLFEHAYTSIWCFFVAVLSVYLVWLFACLPAED